MQKIECEYNDVVIDDTDMKILSSLSTERGKCTSEIVKETKLCKHTVNGHLWKLWAIKKITHWKSGKQCMWKRTCRERRL